MLDNRDIPKNAVTFCNKCQQRVNGTATCTKYPNRIPYEVLKQKAPCKEFKPIQNKIKEKQNERSETMNYSHLIRTDETSKKLKNLLEEKQISEVTMKTLGRWVLFEEEAISIMKLLEEQPNITEAKLMEMFWEIVANYAQKLGMSYMHRESYIMSWAKDTTTTNKEQALTFPRCLFHRGVKNPDRMLTEEELEITFKLLPSQDLLIAKAVELENNKDPAKRKQLLQETLALRDKVREEKKNVDLRIEQMKQKWEQEEEEN